MEELVVEDLIESIIREAEVEAVEELVENIIIEVTDKLNVEDNIVEEYKIKEESQKENVFDMEEEHLSEDVEADDLDMIDLSWKRKVKGADPPVQIRTIMKLKPFTPETIEEEKEPQEEHEEVQGIQKEEEKDLEEPEKQKDKHLEVEEEEGEDLEAGPGQDILVP